MGRVYAPWYAWAYQEAAKASDLWKRWSELHEERYGPERPCLRLVVDNTREAQP